MITSSSIQIKSHKSSYPQIYLKSFAPAAEREDQRVLALFTYFPFYRFKFEISRNARLYPKFLEQFVQHKKRLQQLPAIDMSGEKKRSKKEAKKMRRKAAKATSELQISLNSDGSRLVKSKETQETATSTATSSAKSPATEHHDDSNSNYSFSEFYVPPQEATSSHADEVFKSPGLVENSFEKAIKAVRVASKEETAPEPTKLVVNPFATNFAPLADFIPLGNDENVPTVIIERNLEVVGDARVMLTKDHFRYLSAEKGQNFLFELQNSINVVTQFKWDNTGNSLIITGTPSNQSLCHAEVRNYLFRVDLEHHEKQMEATSQVPKLKPKIVNFLKVNLQNLQMVSKLSIFSAKKMLDNMLAAEKVLNHKKTLRCRRSLNIMFIGIAELANGGQHIGALRRILFMLEKDLEKGKHNMSMELREEIIMHMKPIFSTMDHGDYKKLFNQYSKVMKQRATNKNLLLNPVVLS